MNNEIKTTVESIFNESGRVYNKDGRNRTHRSLQSLLDSGIINFRLAPNGKVFVPKDGFKYNVKITIKKEDGTFLVRRVNINITNIDGYDVLKMIGSFLQTDEAKKEVKSYVNIDASCQKCNGMGIIPMFKHYCNGICFDCYGLGYDSKFKPTVEIENTSKKEKFGRAFINQFYVSGNYSEIFPSGVENIMPFGPHKGHPTAETWLSKLDGFYYIHQPGCMGNSWYKIPESEFEKFKVEYNYYIYNA